jgi:hypothetical protein
MNNTVVGQWLNIPEESIPRTADGEIDLEAEPPRLENGRIDLQGVWMLVISATKMCPTKPGLGAYMMSVKQVNILVKTQMHIASHKVYRKLILSRIHGNLLRHLIPSL